MRDAGLFTRHFYAHRLNELLREDFRAPVLPTLPLLIGLPTEADVLAVPDIPDFVREAYRYVLQREADASGLSHFCQVAREQGRRAVIDGLKASDEGQAQADRWADDPPDAGVDADEDVPAAPDVRRRLSSELSDLAALDDHVAMVARAYLRILGRLPDPAGFAYYVGRLRAGAHPQAILFGLATSAEAAAHGATFTYAGRPLEAPPTERQSRFGSVVGPRLRRFSRAARRLTGTRSDAGSGEVFPEGSFAHGTPFGEGVLAVEIEEFIVGLPASQSAAMLESLRHPDEVGLRRRFRSVVRPGLVVLDAGAKAGLYSLRAAVQTGPAGRVHAFEPDAAWSRVLGDNIRLNGWIGGTVTVHAAPLDASGVDAIARDSGRLDVVKIDPAAVVPDFWDDLPFLLGDYPEVRMFLTFAAARIQAAGRDPELLLDRIERAAFRISVIAGAAGNPVAAPRSLLLRSDAVTLYLSRTRG